MRRIYFDVSDLKIHLAAGNRVSGIQRVTLMVIDHAARLAGPDLEVCLSFVRRGEYHGLRYSPAPDGTALSDHISDLLGIAHSTTDRLPTLEKYKPGSVKHAFHRLRRDYNAMMGNEAFFLRRGTTLEAWRDASRPRRDVPQIASSDSADLSIRATPQDTVFLLGAFWQDSDLPALLGNLRAKGVPILTLVHDLIPILFPQWVSGRHGLKFHDALLGSVDYTSRYIANSACTARDLQDLLQTYGRDRGISTVPLAQTGLGSPEIPAVARTTGIDAKAYPFLVETALVRENVKMLLKMPYVLYVGTWDIRKNLWRLARAWERLAADPNLEMPKLVLAGAPGWGNEDFMRLMEGTGYLGGLVELVRSPSDVELDFLYRNCAFTVFPSLYEGWGLPVGEGLAYGKTAVASERSSIPEVGGDLVEYCDPESTASIAAAIRKLIETEGHRGALEAAISQTHLRTWQDVARDMLSCAEIASDTSPELQA